MGRRGEVGVTVGQIWFGNRVGYRGESLQPYVGYSLEGNYLRGCGRRLSAS